MLRSYGLLVAWQASRLKGFLPLAIVVQALFAFGIVVGFPLLFPEIDRLTILYLATGAFTITLVTIGLVALPQVVSQAKLEGILEYMRSLPVPRMTYLLADLTVWLAIVLPGVVFAVVVGAWSFSLDLAVSSTIVPALLMVAVTAAAVGYALASLLPPLLTVLLTQVLVIGVLLFSPINFPASRLPDWMQAIHSVLPIGAMGEVVRGALAGGVFPLDLAPFLLQGAWCTVALGLSWLTLRRQG